LADKIARFLEEPDLGDDLRRNTRFVLDKLIDFESMVSAYGRVFQEAWLSGDGQ
jgi:hypothetical protein